MHPSSTFSAAVLSTFAILGHAQSTSPATEAKPKAATTDTRPPGGNGDMFYRVFLTQNDANGDGMVKQNEFRGGAARFEAMDKNHNGVLDREEIEELHRSRMADPLSMKQRQARGQMPPGARPPTGSGSPGATAPTTGEPAATVPNGQLITGKQAFQRLDVNTDGKFTAEEFRRSPGQSDAATAKAIAAKVDKDSDGVLSESEFLAVFNQRHAATSTAVPKTPVVKP